MRNRHGRKPCFLVMTTDFLWSVFMYQSLGNCEIITLWLSWLIQDCMLIVNKISKFSIEYNETKPYKKTEQTSGQVVAVLHIDRLFFRPVGLKKVLQNTITIRTKGEKHEEQSKARKVGKVGKTKTIQQDPAR